ncbi:acyltransferase domain-containing protein, partial [Rhodococcus sp. EPR-279]
MTINESTPSHGRGSRSTGNADKSPRSNGGSRTLADRFAAGEPYALAFGGQGAPWLSSLEELARDSALEPELTDLVNEAAVTLAPVADELLVVRSVGFDPIGWMLEQDLADDDTVGSYGPSEAALTSAAVSLPGVFLTQVAALRALKLQGLDPAQTPPVKVVGHSQGLIAAESVAADGAQDANFLAVAQLVGAAAGLVGRRRGIIGAGDRAPMVSVANVEPARLQAIIAELAIDGAPERSAALAIRNGRRRVVLSGPPAQLARVQEKCEQIAAEEE